MIDAAQVRLEKWFLQSASRELLPGQGVAYCFRRHVAIDPEWSDRKDKRVLIKGSVTAKSVWYDNLFRCSSVWSCPVCASHIAQQRRDKLSAAIDKAHKRGWTVVFVTLTMSHHKGDTLRQLSDAMQKAYRRFMSGRWGQDFKKVYGYQGGVRSWDHTVWINSWHPHYHAIWFFDGKVTTKELRDIVTGRWLKVLAENGRTADDEHAVDITTANDRIVPVRRCPD